MKEIVTDVSNIKDVVNERCIYVDKTAYLHKLITSSRRLFFISRPRRFGKSLMLSTLKAIFEGRKELFEGLAISKTDYDWKPYPVLYMDMTGVRASEVSGIREGLNDMVLDISKHFGISIEPSSDPEISFERLWKEIRNANLQVVVLVDEYDVPLQGFLHRPQELEQIRQVMHEFYVRLKMYSDNIRFMMMTGVSKFAKLSVFSGLNNVVDLSMNADYAGMLGYTHEELMTYFSEHMDAFAAKENVSREKIMERLLEWYDNYRFSPQSDVKVMNPVSVGSAFNGMFFKGFWISTGGSSIILERLRKAGTLPSDLEHLTAFEDWLDECDAITMPVVSLLYQGGYLTIKDVERNGKLHLGTPNTEVKQALASGYLAREIENTADLFGNQLNAVEFLREGKLSEAIEEFRGAIAALPYEWVTKGKEAAVKTAFAMFFYAMYNSHVTYEHESLNGRSDAIVETKNAVYVFEFKYDQSAQEAFDQILEKRYFEAYVGGGKPIYGIGLNFNPKEGQRGVEAEVVGEIG